MRKADSFGSEIVHLLLLFTISGHPGALFYKCGFAMCQNLFQGLLTTTKMLLKVDAQTSKAFCWATELSLFLPAFERVGFPGSWLERNRDDSMF